jgi:CBS domain-containing protein
MTLEMARATSPGPCGAMDEPTNTAQEAAPLDPSAFSIYAVPASGRCRMMPCERSTLWEVTMQVGDILRKKTARVATVRMDETVAIAAQLMRASNIGALVVKDVVRTEGDTAAGMFTEHDVVRAIAEHGAAGLNLKVSRLISVQQLVCCCSTDELKHARRLMNKNRIGHLPVIDNHDLIGVISISDISAAHEDEAHVAGRVVPA